MIYIFVAVYGNLHRGWFNLAMNHSSHGIVSVSSGLRQKGIVELETCYAMSTHEVGRVANALGYHASWVGLYDDHCEI